MFESLSSKLDSIRKNNHNEWIETPLMNSVLFDEDLNKINNAVSRYPMGSYQIGEIAKLSGLLYEMGIDVVDMLQRTHSKYTE